MGEVVKGYLLDVRVEGSLGEDSLLMLEDPALRLSFLWHFFFPPAAPPPDILFSDDASSFAVGLASQSTTPEAWMCSRRDFSRGCEGAMKLGLTDLILAVSATMTAADEEPCKYDLTWQLAHFSFKNEVAAIVGPAVQCQMQLLCKEVAFNANLEVIEGNRDSSLTKSSMPSGHYSSLNCMKGAISTRQKMRIEQCSRKH
jgi:hypothetical protein